MDDTGISSDDAGYGSADGKCGGKGEEVREKGL